MIFNRAALGASGILFMMILLSSFTNVKHGMVPLTFLLIIVLYFGREIYASIAIESNISHFGHIVGGLCGAVLGFYISKLQAEKEIPAISEDVT
jgi:membrane associated rhomboid family serine protease